jgi:hypothetical protein
MLRADRYLIKCKSNHRFLYISPPDGSKEEKAVVLSTPEQISNEYVWSVEELGANRYWFKLFDKKKHSECLAMEVGTHGPILAKANMHHKNQRWILEPSSEPFTYFIMSEAGENFALDGDAAHLHAENHEHIPFYQKLERDRESQKWIFEPVLLHRRLASSDTKSSQVIILNPNELES